jgi:hypothetical protein
VIPPKENAAFVASMEDVIEVYHRPHDAAKPLVCLDETSKQLVAETRTPLPAQPGQPARHDYEYERNGTANLFMLFAPLGVDGICCGAEIFRVVPIGTCVNGHAAQQLS